MTMTDIIINGHKLTEKQATAVSKALEFYDGDLSLEQEDGVLEERENATIHRSTIAEIFFMLTVNPITVPHGVEPLTTQGKADD
jgi:hypothetical protein